jgi:hypothetical protein
MAENNNFAKLAAVDVSRHIEKKQNLSYLSWAWAVDQLMRADASANWTFHEPVKYGESMMVSCTVTAFGKPITMHLPVMDHRNQAVKNPDAFVVNKNMMRCLVKAIACHGLGLYIYAGEDLPADEEGNPAQQAPKQQAPAKQAAPKSPAAGPGLSEESMEAVTVAMVEADDIASLQKTFGDAYKKANAAQQVALKKTYDEVKTILTTGATA